jgi:hypothetical protein
LNIAPKVGSPLSATAGIDPVTGIVMVSSHHSSSPESSLTLIS